MQPPIKFTAEDPRGFIVICYIEQWYDHILLGHPEMEDLIDEIIKTIEYPTFIFGDTDFDDRISYYYMSTGKPRYVKVVVQFTTVETGEVISAFLTDSGKSGERLIWPSSD